jgi:hypothetical protein
LCFSTQCPPHHMWYLKYDILVRGLQKKKRPQAIASFSTANNCNQDLWFINIRILARRNNNNMVRVSYKKPILRILYKMYWMWWGGRSGSLRCLNLLWPIGSRFFFYRLDETCWRHYSIDRSRFIRNNNITCLSTEIHIIMCLN